MPTKDEKKLKKWYNCDLCISILLALEKKIYFLIEGISLFQIWYIHMKGNEIPQKTV